jgi:hypothetical protein
LILMRLGFRQSDVLLLVAHLRPRLATAFAAILRSPPQLGGKSAAKPTEDRRVFLVIEHIAFRYGRKPAQRLRTPSLCKGIGELSEVFDQMGHLFGRAIVVEIAHMATMTTEFLEQAPLKKRGRSPGT